MSETSASKRPSTRLSDPQNRAKLFNEILNDLISKRQESIKAQEPAISEYKLHFSNSIVSADRIEEVIKF